MKKILTLLAIAIVGLTSCKPEEEVQYSISVEPTELTFTSAGGEKTVKVTSSGLWELYGECYWCAPSLTYGEGNAEIVFTVQPNTDAENSRSCTFEFVSGDKYVVNLSVTQDKKEYSISIEPTELTFGAEGGEQEIVVTSSDRWIAGGGSNWCDASISSGDNVDTVKFSVAPYYDRNKTRTALINFSTGNQDVELKITQQRDVSPIIQFKDPRFLSKIHDSYNNAYSENNLGNYLFGEDVFRPSFGGYVYASYFDLHRDQFDFEFDKNGDGEISENEAEHGTGLQLRKISWFEDYDIRDMGEIKYFTALEYLDCKLNDLTTLDLSNNTALEYLVCTSNGLTTLDLSNSTALVGLDCASNDLTTLDLSNNTVLEYLDCSGNYNLKTLDLSNNTALEYLDCSGNDLTTLDLSNNTALEYLVCSGLTTLDLSNNTALVSLDCRFNDLTTLDLSNNTALTRLYCKGNNLSKIILPKFYKLEDSYIADIIEEYGDIIEYVE